MKKSVFLIGSLVFSLYLTGCARNNVNDDVATRNRNVNEPTRVNYNPNGGPAITGVDNRDTRLNRNNVTDVRNDNQNRMSVADEAADRVAALSEVDTANVIASDDNAFVAVKLSGSSRLTNDLENKISDKVKSVDRDIDNVYVSANPDFYGQMNQWAGDIRNGKPVTGFFKEFSDSVRRVFPDLKD